MQKMLKLALGAALATSLVVPAMAQENFPDVPANHWAYEALRNLKDKVLFGYPDGLYRGNRPMSRYEFAVAVNQLHQLLSGRISALESQVASLEDLIKNQPKGGDTAALQGLRDQLASLTKKVDGLDAGQAELKKLVEEFRKELTSLGVDVDAMKKDIADLEARVTTLEKIKPAVTISGDANLLVLGGYSQDGNYGLATSGQTLGRGRVAPFGPVGADKDLSVLHEAAISLTSTNETGPKYKGTFVMGNILGTLGQDLSGNPGNGTTIAEAASDTYINELYVTFDHSLFGQGFSAVVGRFGHSNLDYVLKRQDNTPYYENARWDDGKYILDGAALMFKFGESKLNVWGGRTGGGNGNAVQSINNGLALTPLWDRTLGADATVKAGPVDLGLAYAILSGDNLMQGANQAHAMGAEAKTSISGIGLKAGAAKTILKHNDDTIRSSKSSAYYGELEYKQDRWGVSGGYREIETGFANPGSWGSFGTELNPTGIKGFYGKVWFKATDALKLYATGDFYEGKTGNNGELGSLLVTKDDDLQGFKVGAEYKLSDVFGVDASYEDYLWKMNNTSDPYQRWFTLGFNWTMSEKAKFRLFWQYSDADDKGTGYFTNGLGLGADKFKGGLIGSQISIKF